MEDDDTCGRPWNDPHPFGKPLRPKGSNPPAPPKPLECEAPPAKRPQQDSAGRRHVTWREDTISAATETAGFSGCVCGGVAAALRLRGAAEGVRSGLRRAAQAMVRVARLPRSYRRQGGRHFTGGGGSAGSAGGAAAMGYSKGHFTLEEQEDAEEFSPVAGAKALRHQQLYGGGWRPATGMVALCELDLSDLASTASWRNDCLEDVDDLHGSSAVGAGANGGRWFYPGPPWHVDLVAPTPAPTPRVAAAAAAAAATVADGVSWQGASAAAAAAAVAAATVGPGDAKDGARRSVGNCGPPEAATTFRLWASESYNSSSSYNSQTSPTSFAAPPSAAFPSPAAAAATAMAATAAATVLAKSASLGRTDTPAGSGRTGPPQPQPPATVGCWGKAPEEGLPLLPKKLGSAPSGEAGIRLQRSLGERWAGSVSFETSN